MASYVSERVRVALFYSLFAVLFAIGIALMTIDLDSLVINAAGSREVQGLPVLNQAVQVIATTEELNRPKLNLCYDFPSPRRHRR